MWGPQKTINARSEAWGPHPCALAACISRGPASPPPKTHVSPSREARGASCSRRLVSYFLCRAPFSLVRSVRTSQLETYVVDFPTCCTRATSHGPLAHRPLAHRLTRLTNSPTTQSQRANQRSPPRSQRLIGLEIRSGRMLDDASATWPWISSVPWAKAGAQTCRDVPPRYLHRPASWLPPCYPEATQWAVTPVHLAPPSAASSVRGTKQLC